MTTYSGRKALRLGAVILLLGSLATSMAFAQMSFIARKEFKIPTFHDPNSVVTADFNGDGIPDLAVLSRVVTPDPRGLITILVGDGFGNFYFDPLNVYHNQNSGAELITADFNGDGRPDLAVTNEDSNSVSVYLNDGTGYFNAPTHIGVGNKPVGLVA